MEKVPNLTNIMNILELPPEIISHILTFLSYYDLHSARLTCISLYKASISPVFIGIEKVLFDKQCLKVQPVALLESQREYWHFEFQHDRSFSYTHDVWSNLGPNLKSLSFAYCKLTEQDFFAVLSHCSGLESLNIYSCFIVISQETEAKPDDYWKESSFEGCGSPLLKNLRKLQVEDRLDYRIFWKILSNAPKLQSLSVKDFQVPKPEYVQPTNSALIERINTPALPLTYDHVFVYLKACGHRLLELELFLKENVTNVETTNTISTVLSNMQNLQLRKFSTNLNPSLEFIKNQKKCQDLRLHVNSSRIQLLSEELQELKHLDVSSNFVSTADIRKLTNLKNLLSLKVSLHEAQRDLEHDVFSGLCGEINTKLQGLELIGSEGSGFVETSPKCIIGIVGCYLALTKLDLSHLGGITNISVQSIFYHLVQLETLKLRGCTNLTTSGLRGKVMSDDELAGTNAPTGYSISRLKKLKVLDLSDCEPICNIFRSSPESDALKLPALREVCLGTYYDTFKVKAMIALVENNPTIEVLDLPYGFYFTNKLTEAILKNLTHLKRIIVGWNNFQIKKSNLERLQKVCVVKTCNDDFNDRIKIYESSQENEDDDLSGRYLSENDEWEESSGDENESDSE